jgi:hypothetical protein
VVVDGQWYKMLGAATRVAVPALALRSDSAATFLSMLATPRLVADGYLPVKGTLFYLREPRHYYRFSHQCRPHHCQN